MPESVQELSEQLTEKWGPDVRRICHQLNDLIGRALSQGDLLGYAYIAQVVSQIMIESCDLARQLQAERQQEQVPGKGMLH